jgi:hypothetical protein
MPHQSIAPEATTPPRRAYFRRLEICQHFGFCSRTFDRLRADGVIPPPERQVGSHNNKRLYGLWSLAQVEAMFRDGSAASTPPAQPQRTAK